MFSQPARHSKSVCLADRTGSGWTQTEAVCTARDACLLPPLFTKTSPTAIVLPDLFFYTPIRLFVDEPWPFPDSGPFEAGKKGFGFLSAIQSSAFCCRESWPGKCAAGWLAEPVAGSSLAGRWDSFRTWLKLFEWDFSFPVSQHTLRRVGCW